MKITIDTKNINSIMIDGKSGTVRDIDNIIAELVEQREIDAKQYAIGNKYLRYIVKQKGYEYHILERPAGVYSFWYVGSERRRVECKIQIPNTVMILKFKYSNGKYMRMTERLFHTLAPVNKELNNIVFRWGLSNVYDDMHICWGDGKLPEVDEENSYKLFDEFFLGTKNSDLLNRSKFNWTDVLPLPNVNKLEINKLIKTRDTVKEIIDSF